MCLIVITELMMMLSKNVCAAVLAEMPGDKHMICMGQFGGGSIFQR